MITKEDGFENKNRDSKHALALEHDYIFDAAILITSLKTIFITLQDLFQNI